LTIFTKYENHPTFVWNFTLVLKYLGSFIPNYNICRNAQIFKRYFVKESKEPFDIHKNIVFPTWNILGRKWNRWKTFDMGFFKNQI
jgi:hypothetical protein